MNIHWRGIPCFFGFHRYEKRNRRKLIIREGKNYIIHEKFCIDCGNKLKLDK